MFGLTFLACCCEKTPVRHDALRPHAALLPRWLTDPRSTPAADLCCCAKVDDDEANAQLTYGAPPRGKPPQGAYIARP
eukprot:340599-Prymnesium_polylepis.2